MRSLTEDERLSLGQLWNLADAHCRQNVDVAAERQVIDELASLFAQTAAQSYSTLEERAGRAFLASMNQVLPIGRRPIAVYSSSVATMIVARVLRRHAASVRLTCPTFDNIAALLIGEGLTVEPVDDDVDVRELQLDPPAARSACVFLVSPNNPTGNYLDAPLLADLAGRCAEKGVVLVLDASFRGQVGEACFDHYGILEAAGVHYVVIEDTGKLWPVQDLKCGFIVASRSLQPELEAVSDDVLLSIAPLLLGLVEAFSELSRESRFASLRDLVHVNRGYLRRALADVPSLSVVHDESSVSVELLRVHPAHRADELIMCCSNRGVAILDARKFYWSDVSRGFGEVRVSLARDASYFRAGLDILREEALNIREWDRTGDE